jgi:uncharacterized protein YecE (DUF72 family)
MPANIYIGCCGWSYLHEEEFESLSQRQFSSKLQAYAWLFDAVEINSTFYRIPKVSTAEKWRREASVIRPQFLFTVKAYRGITHIDRFGARSRSLFESVVPIVTRLTSPVVLFQSPASFHPTVANIRKMRGFFESIDRQQFLVAWEPRGTWYEHPEAIIDLCEEQGLAHCVDPFRNRPLTFAGANIAYFRLHGFGKPTMYNYDFSAGELDALQSIVQSLPRSLKDVYIFFNNAACYANGVAFATLVAGMQ